MMRLLLIPFVPAALVAIVISAVVFAPMALWRASWGQAVERYTWSMSNVIGFALVYGARLWRGA